ncbi:MAG: hypothetical protein GX159_11215 [Flavobacteriaceae bacterium]|jgi:hypothetical protein|nr:hypothetical protein [Flavobacteriaceae bacterium]
MIDNIKITITNYSPNEKINWKPSNKDNSAFPHKTFQKAKLFNGKFKKKKHSLKLLLTADERKDEFSLSISGSIRKWYYQENSRKDLNHTEFVDCIRLLADEIGVRESELWNTKVMKVEVGVTLLVDKKFKGIKDCFVRYRNASRFEKGDEITTVYFGFKNYKLKIYDKYLEMNKRKNLDSYPYNEVNERLHFPRFEIAVNKVSGTPFFKSKANTLRKIEENWDEILKEFGKRFGNINFVNVLTDENGLREIGTYAEFRNFLAYEGINNYGLSECLDCLNHTGILDNNKTKYINDLIKLYESFKVKDDQLKAEFFERLEKKLNRIYNKSNIE